MNSDREPQNLWEDIFEERNLCDSLYSNEEICWIDNLKGTELNKSKFEVVIFENCNMAHSSWEGAEFDNVLFKDCDLSNASFRNVYAKGLVLMNCDVNKLDMSGGKFDNLEVLDCKGSIHAEATDFIVPKFWDCDIEDSEFSRSDLSSAQFLRSNVAYSHFTAADLSNTEFKECDISECDMVSARNLVTYGKRPMFTDCIMSPTSTQDNSYMAHLIRGPRESYESMNYSRVATLLCSNMEELDNLELV